MKSLLSGAFVSKGKKMEQNDDQDIIIEENEAERNSEDVAAFTKLLFLMLTKEGQYVLARDNRSLIKQSFGASAVLTLHRLSESSFYDTERYFDGFVEQRGYGQSSAAVFYRFVFLADDYDHYRDQMQPVFKNCEQKCENARIICEFDVIDLASKRAFEYGGREIRERSVREIFEKALQKEDYSAAAETERQAASKVTEEIREDLMPRRVNPIFNISNIIIFANVLIFIIQTVMEADGDYTIYAMGVQANGYILNGQVWRLFTAMFLHADITHLLGNMFMLFYLGTIILRYYSPGEFALIYFTGGLLGNLLTLVFMPVETLSLGASGAIMALGGTLIYRMFFGKHKKLFRRTGNFVTIAMMVLFNLFYGLTQSQTNNFGHFGGFAAGFAVAWLIYLVKNKRREEKS